MRKTDYNALFREYVKSNLSPTQSERDFFAGVYDAFKTTLSNNCILIGSYARFTASRPLHDLDILFIAGRFDPNNLHPQDILTDLHNNIQKNFKNPTKYQFTISQQTHSITVSFIEKGEEKFAVDVVPAFTSGSKNEFGDDIYWVPEIVKVGKKHRAQRYDEFTKSKKTELEWWLKSDPRGYIKAATDLNAKNNDFRKAAKFIKKWKHNCKEDDDDFKLKSFHIEQIVFRMFEQDPSREIFDAVFDFFCSIPDIISSPQIQDRADSTKYIDEYIGSLTDDQRKKIMEARDFFLIKLENFDSDPDVSNLLDAGFHTRRSLDEAYLFDSRIPVFIEKSLILGVTGDIQPRTQGGFRGGVLDAVGFINVDRHIIFRSALRGGSADMFKWKVKNDDSSPQPRGEITDHSTKNEKEYTQYNGDHYVECYAIRDNTCVARGRQNVVLKFLGRPD